MQKILTLQLNFPPPSVFDFCTDHWNPNFQYVIEKRAHHETYKRFWGNLPRNSQQKSYFILEGSPLLFHFICSII